MSEEKSKTVKEILVEAIENEAGNLLPNTTLGEIVENYLNENNYGGLYSPDGGCACSMRSGDLFPCDSCLNDCVPGYYHEDKTGEFPFVISRSIH